MQFTKKLPKLVAGFAAGAFVVSMISTHTNLSLVSEAQAQATDEIIVTARKRSESIQDVPVAVSALTAAQLQKGNIPMTQDLGKLVPNVALHDMAYAGAGLSASIRGLNYDDTEKSNDPAVGVTVDGVFAANNGGVNLDLFDVESIEVLRGPQGTLYGRNTIGGVININRSKPTRELGAKFQVGVEEDNTKDLQAVVNFPIGDRAGLKIAVRDLNADNWMYNVTTGRNDSDFKDVQSHSIRLNADVTDNITVDFIYDEVDDKSQRNNLAITSNTLPFTFCTGIAPAGIPADPLKCASASADLSAANDYSTTYDAAPFGMTYETENLSLNVDIDLGNHTLKSITGDQDSFEQMIISSWGSPTIVFPVTRNIGFEQFSQEFQLISDFDGPLSYVLGYYYLDASFDQESGPIQNFVSGQELEATAIFGEVSYDIDEEWSVTLGLRYTEEEKDFFVRNFAGATAVADKFAFQGSGTIPAAGFANAVNEVYEDDYIQHRFIVERNFDNGMVYASVSNGFRSGGIFARCTDPVTCAPFGTEEVINYEAGLRLEPSDALVFNITAFMADYKDKQEQVTTNGLVCGNAASATCTFSLNAAEVSISGLEIESRYYANENLSLNTAIGILDSDYDSYDDGGVDISDIAKLRMAPEVTFNFGFDYDVNLAGGDLTVSGSYSGRDSYWGQANWKTFNFAQGPNVEVDSYESLDLSATFRAETSNGNQIRVTVFGNDILEEGGRIARPFDAGAFAFAAPAKRQHFGMKIGYEF